jgi:hypothetical protein
LTCILGWHNSNILKKEEPLTQSLFIFVSGLSGVFLGMALLYVSIRITALVVSSRAKKEEEK